MLGKQNKQTNKQKDDGFFPLHIKGKTQRLQQDKSRGVA